MDTKNFKVIFLPLLITNLLGCVYYECPFENLSDEQQEKHLTMMKNIFAQQKQNDTKNKFIVQIKIYTTSLQKGINNTNVFSKTYESSANPPKTANNILQTIWGTNFNTNFHQNLIQLGSEIFNTLPTKTYIQNHSNLRTIDSEFQFFADFFSQDMLLRLTERDEITRIEIHGFTTRDMCPCCFTHMGLFYDRLKEALNGPASVNENSLFYNFIQQINPFLPQGSQVQLAFYISSSIQLGLQEFDGSIYPSYAGTMYNNSVKNITKFYTLKKQSEGESPTEGIFCTFIREDNPNWSLQYSPFSKEIYQIGAIKKPENFDSNLEQNLNKYIKCTGKNDCTICFKSNKLSCTKHPIKQGRKASFTVTISKDEADLPLFRKLLSNEITQEVFSSAKGKSASF